MTSLQHDDSIEILTSASSTAAIAAPPPGGAKAQQASHVIDLGLTLVGAASGVVRPIAFVGIAPRHGRHFRRKPLAARKPMDAKEKRIKRAVMAIATFMILASMILVGASLSMSDHIDEMGQ